MARHRWDEPLQNVFSLKSIPSLDVLTPQIGEVIIPGSSNPDHIKENISIFDFELTDEEMSRINALDRNEKHDWY